MGSVSMAYCKYYIYHIFIYETYVVEIPIDGVNG